jgi:hypothetical protein
VIQILVYLPCKFILHRLQGVDSVIVIVGLGERCGAVENKKRNCQGRRAGIAQDEIW